MPDFWLYDRMSRFGYLNYRAKIMLVAFIGTHIPLIALVGFVALRTAPDWWAFAAILGTALVATLVGTGLTLFALNALLCPVLATSRTLRGYREFRQPATLPTGYADEAGTLMADAVTTITSLETIRNALEFIDDVTGLPNRKRFLQSIERRIAEAERFGVTVVRFANFDRIAEALDLKHADAAANELATRLTAALNDTTILARTAQCEFAFLSTDPGPGGSALTPALTALLARAGGDIALGEFNLQPELLCGVAVYPDDSAAAAELLDAAGAASAQAVPAMPVALHSKQARALVLERMRMEQELRRAIECSEFTLHYQPVIDLDAGEARGAEALIRWQHPKLGMLPPGRFIPAAEASGLVMPMGLWVMRRACQQIREWNDAGRNNLKVAVNLSARQFSDPDLKRHVVDALGAAGIDPSALEIELTETAAMADHQHTKRVFTMLRDLGVSIAIDDFGTGYASMSYLQKLPFDKLKVDREFVCDVDKLRNKQAICGALIALGNGLGLKVLAEGAERGEEVRYLHKLGCRLFQGYYFAKPLPASEFGPAIDALRRSPDLQRPHSGADEREAALAG